jgi:hypothetical protein
MENKFEPKDFRFASGVKITLNAETVTAVADNGKAVIESKQLDNFHYTEHSQARISSFALVARTFGIGVVLIFISGDQWRALAFKSTAFNNLALWIGLLCFLVGIVAFFVEMIDVFLQLGLYKKLIASVFSDKGYSVSIGNKSGNNINFLAGEHELPIIQNLEKKLTELKKYLETQQLQPIAPITNTSDATLDNLKKLGDLYQSGILTKDEFEQKKTELLSK